ncbi:SRPBCC domain-containing protein [Rummeliibacillus sp. NPDC094406]|uniref:SRPBCC domain-containing protein n=1 Tax=Rummeliibacillus sp. NPDC094406 TaxID=3364511 RepID=UPI00380923DC
MGKLKFEIKEEIKARPEKVWTELTNNDEIKKWFPEMSYHEDGSFGYYRWFDGNMDMKLNVFRKENNKLIGFEWAGNTVDFQLIEKDDFTELVFFETLNEIVKHTPKDLAGWYVCIEKIRHLAEETGEIVDEELWKNKYEEYRKVFEMQ